MTSMAVTASAEYQISGVVSEDKYYLRVVGLPETIVNHSDYEVIGITVTFEDHDKAIFIYIDRTDDYRVDCYIQDQNDNVLGDLRCDLLTFDGFGGELGLMIEFPGDNEYLAEFMEYGTAGILFFGNNFDGGTHQVVFYNSNGEEVDYGTFEITTVTWETLNTTGESQPAESETASSESTSSEPAPEPVSSEPAPEPVSSEPVSETVNSEPTASQPTNVDTGVAGIAAVVGTAVLAAGAVIVTRKKK